MGVWADRVVPRLTDKALSADEVMQLRAIACAGLAGRVLEIGFGSGLNIEKYPPEVASVDAVEPADAGWALSAGRRRRTDLPIVRTGLDGQHLAADDASYDAVLSTFTLCTIPEAAVALAEVRRVLRPGGTFHFLEHGLAADDRVVTWQHRLEPLQQRVFAGCHLTRDVPALVTAAGLELTMLEASYLPGPAVSRPWSYGYLGRAVR
jgi:ubiquinone/menaquinone biosynthesis C-methylase UbiE